MILYEFNTNKEVHDNGIGDKQKSIVVHKVIHTDEGPADDTYSGVMVVTHFNPAGQPVGQQKVFFPIKSPTLVGAFVNFNSAFDDYKKEIERQQRQARIQVPMAGNPFGQKVQG